MPNSGVPYTEPIAVPDVFATGLARIEEAGGNLRLTFYVDQLSMLTGEMERLIVARIVVPLDKFLVMREKTTLALAGITGVVDDTYINVTH